MTLVERQDWMLLRFYQQHLRLPWRRRLYSTPMATKFILRRHWFEYLVKKKRDWRPTCHMFGQKQDDDRWLRPSQFAAHPPAETKGSSSLRMIDIDITASIAYLSLQTIF